MSRSKRIAFDRKLRGVFERFLKVFSVFDQVNALRDHGAVFLNRVAVGNYNDRMQTEEARAMPTPWP